MVDSKRELLDNIVDFPSRTSKPLARTAANPDAKSPAGGSSSFARQAAFPAVDFSLPSFHGENRQVVMMIGFSLAMTLVLAGASFAVVTLAFKLMSIFAAG